MTFWLGGLVYFFTAVRQLRQLDGQLRTRLTSLLASQFSFYALIFVGLIGLTGFYSAYLRVGSIPALIDTLYGHVLLVKQVFVAGLLVIAATNLLVISPRLKRDRLQGISDPGVVERFGKLLILELTFAGLLLASVSFLTYLPPARVASPNTDLIRRASVDDLKIQYFHLAGTCGTKYICPCDHILRRSPAPFCERSSTAFHTRPAKHRAFRTGIDWSGRWNVYGKRHLSEHPWRLAGTGSCAASGQIRCICQFQLYASKAWRSRSGSSHLQTNGLADFFGRVAVRIDHILHHSQAYHTFWRRHPSDAINDRNSVLF